MIRWTREENVKSLCLIRQVAAIFLSPRGHGARFRPTRREKETPNGLVSTGRTEMTLATTRSNRRNDQGSDAEGGKRDREREIHRRSGVLPPKWKRHRRN